MVESHRHLFPSLIGFVIARTTLKVAGNRGQMTWLAFASDAIVVLVAVRFVANCLYCGTRTAFY